MKPQYQQSTAPRSGSMKIVELMETVQGEGFFIGVPSIFVRTGMCNLSCPGCDTKWDAWDETSFEAVADRVKSFNAKHVVITGGEPLLWQGEISNLLKLLDGYTITVESNAAVPIRNLYLKERVDLWSFSPKVGSLGHEEVFSKEVCLENIIQNTNKCQVKYVLDPNVPAHADSVFEFQDRLDTRNLLPDDRIYFQPYDRDTEVNVYQRLVPLNESSYSRDLAALTKLVMERSGSRFRVLPQLHKLLLYR